MQAMEKIVLAEKKHPPTPCICSSKFLPDPPCLSRKKLDFFLAPFWLWHLAKIAFFGILVFKSLDLPGNGLKRFILWWSNISHHSHMWKNSEIGPKRARKVTKMAKNSQFTLKWINLSPWWRKFDTLIWLWYSDMT